MWTTHNNNIKKCLGLSYNWIHQRVFTSNLGSFRLWVPLLWFQNRIISCSVISWIISFPFSLSLFFQLHFFFPSVRLWYVQEVSKWWWLVGNWVKDPVGNKEKGSSQDADRSWISCIYLIKGVESSLRSSPRRTKGVSARRLEALENRSHHGTTQWG